MRSSHPGLVDWAVAMLACAQAVAWADPTRSPVAGRFVSVGRSGPIPHAEDTHPMFADWLYCPGQPVVCRFEASPATEYQVLVGLTEAYWETPGQRVVDLEVAGRVVATVDTFGTARSTPQGYLFRATSDSEGSLLVRVLPHPGAPDQNPAVCGVLLYAADADVDVDTVVHGGGPAPLASLLAGESRARLLENRGAYFTKTHYTPEVLPAFAGTRDRLPSPIFDEDPSYVRCYWRAWELAFDHFRRPAAGSPFVSNYIDENFNDSLFLWDTAFMTMFCNYGHPYVPGIQSLDNFYCTQLSSGEIVREVSEITGIPHPASEPGTPDSLNHPILAWAEREAYRLSGDKARLRLVYEPLVRYYRSYEAIRDEPTGFYRTSWASMDNSPRLDEGRLACGIDTTAEMVLFARDLAYIARQLGRTRDALAFEAEADALAERMNTHLWDDASGFYYDWATDGRRLDVRTIAGYWPLLAGVARPEQARRLVEHLRDPACFGRLHLVPTVPADQAGYDTMGEYWRGGVWTPTNLMVVRALERAGYAEDARTVALNHLASVARVFEETGTVWEFYAPDTIAPGTVDGHRGRPDFVGWTGACPIVLLIEHAIGVRADAPANTIVWDLRTPARVGVERLWFGGTTVSLVAEAADAAGRRTVTVSTDRPFHLSLQYRATRVERDVSPGPPVALILKR